MQSWQVLTTTRTLPHQVAKLVNGQTDLRKWNISKSRTEFEDVEVDQCEDGSSYCTLRTHSLI